MDDSESGLVSIKEEATNPNRLSLYLGYVPGWVPNFLKNLECGTQGGLL